MVSIQEFARLCHCSAQTLRYYDKIGLFHPRHVEGSSGYRFYAIDQIEEFFRIKELQAVGFSIRKIQELKGLCEEDLMKLLDEKIAEQEKLLAKTRALKQTYQKRKMELTEEIRVYQEMEKIDVTWEDKVIHLKKGDCSYKVRMVEEASGVGALLHEMQEQAMIDLDLCIFHEHEGSMWGSYTVSGWVGVDDAIARLRDEHIAKAPLALHLFLINEKTTLRDIQALIENMVEHGMGDDESLFSVSLAKDHRNTYGVLYPLS